MGTRDKRAFGDTIWQLDGKRPGFPTIGKIFRGMESGRIFSHKGHKGNKEGGKLHGSLGNRFADIEKR